MTRFRANLNQMNWQLNGHYHFSDITQQENNTTKQFTIYETCQRVHEEVIT